MTAPTLLLEVAFESDPGDDPQVWEDVSEYVRAPGWTLDGGQSEPGGEFTPQVLNVTLANDDRRFDPTNADSPYYPGVLPMRRIRITVAGIVLFTGFVDGWPIRHQGGHSTITVTASDGSETLEKPLPSVWSHLLAATAPDLWWRLGESSGTLAEDASGNARPGGYEGGATFHSRAGLVADDTDNGIMLEGLEAANPVYVWRNENPIAGPGDFTVGWWMSHEYDQSGEFQPRPIAYGGNDTLGFWRVWSRSGDSGLGFMTGDATSGVTLASYTDPLNDGDPHLVMFRRSGTTLDILVDGAVVATASGSTHDLAAGPTILGVGDPLGLLGGLPGVVYDEFAMWAEALTDQQIADLYAAGSAPWDGDTTGERAEKILALAGWPADLRDIDTGQVVLGAASIQGDTARAALAELAETEAGAYYHDRDGAVRFRERHALYRSPMTDVQATISSEPDYDDPDLGLTFSSAAPQVTKTGIVNVVTVNGAGVSATAEDAASQARFLRRPGSAITSLSPDADDVRYRAQFELELRKDERLDLGELTLDPIAFPALWDTVLGLHYEDRVRVIAQPLGGGDPIDVEAFIGSVSHDASGDEWVTRWRLFQANDSASEPWSVFGDGSTEASQFGAARFAY